jgi:ABC-type multidrug transport system fused ATPase/permease subunit
MMRSGAPSMRRAEGAGNRSAPAASTDKKKKIDSKAAWREFRELLYVHRRRLTIGLGLMLISRLSGFVLPAISGRVIDDVFNATQPNIDLLHMYALMAGAATLVQAVTSFGLSQILGVAAQRAITDMRKRVQAKVMRLPVRYFDSTQSGVLLSRIMSDADGIRNLVGTGLVQLVGGLLTAVISFGVLLYLNWRLTLITAVVLGAFGGGMAYAFQRLRPLFRERGKIQAEVSGRLTEALGGIRIVKSYTAEKREEIVFTKGAHKLFRNIAQSMTGVSATTAAGTVIVGVVGVVMIWLGGNDIMAGRMTLGQFVTYIFFIGLLAAPLISIASIGTQITEAFAGLDRIREILNMQTEDEADAGKPALGPIQGDIKFEDVWFEYNEGVPVLKDVTFHAAPGTTTALVGSSGSGKSTLISLVMAFNRPLKGRIIVDGQDLTDIPLRDYREQLASVLQENFLFDGTIAENIGYARPGATLDEIKHAARTAHCEEFILKFPEGYDTIVGERGIKLSGGQRQRVSIARAILASPKVLILDEATSSLDSESEEMIQDGLKQLRTGRTTFVIAHRLSTIRSADQILVMEGGEIVERGTHDELLARDGRYRQLYDKQYKLETNRFINPGEDWTPELPKPVAVKPASNQI